MKTYLDFTLTGKKFLPIWIVFYLLVLLPYSWYNVAISIQHKTLNDNPFLGYVVLLIMLIGILLYFFILKITIESIRYQNNNIIFSGKFLTYLGKALLGFFLSIITLTIYLAWYIKDMTRYFINNSSLNSSNFIFEGKGSKLFLIFLLCLFVPIIMLFIIIGRHLLSNPGDITYVLIYQALIMLLMVPFMYLFYKWFLDIKYKNYHIHWETKFFESSAKILLEIFLSIITIGIYLPLAYMKLYKYFAERTFANTEENETFKFGYDLDAAKDFIFIWGQILLSIITLGLYYPWAYCKIGKRVLNKTFLIKNVS